VSGDVNIGGDIKVAIARLGLANCVGACRRAVLVGSERAPRIDPDAAV
jgi:hypothetical protein